jgi:hypothetical protein
MTTALHFTRYTSTAPERLTKTLRMDEAGQLVKQAGADMVQGTAEHMCVANLSELAQVLDALKPNQAVGWGVPKSSQPGSVLNVVTKDQRYQQPDIPNLIARDREHVEYLNSPGLMMLDHDGGHDGEALSAEELRVRLIMACPCLADAPMLCRLSASAGVTAPDGRILTGQTKHRFYIPVTCAADIPEAGKRLMGLLWEITKTKPGKFAWSEVGKAGQVLMRGLLDAQVWQPERLDFAAGPILCDGLTRPGTTSSFFGDLAGLFPLGMIRSADDHAVQAAQREARKAVSSRASAAREKWAEEKAPDMALRRGLPVEKARAILLRAADNTRVLMGDFELIGVDGKRVSVGDILDNAEKWHDARFADPLDPDTDRRVAYVNLKSGGRPFLYTHRHGGLRFELCRQSARVQIGRGRRIESTDAVLQVLRERGELYEFGESAVAYVAEGRARTVSVDWLTDHMGRVCEFYYVRRKEDAGGNISTTETPDDAPQVIARAILAKHGSRGLARLVSVVTAPTLRPDGSILSDPGHDADSGLFYWSDLAQQPKIHASVTPADALKALRVLWDPFKLFPLVDDVARGVALHGLLTATIRASLPTAPGIGFDAPAAGSGKTLLARCIGILATGSDPSILPPADTDEETRKRLFAALREGHRVILWDNVREPLGNASLDSFLTASTFADRILGSSETASLPNRAMFIATGNNMRLSSDTCRRVLLARIDAETETPYTRDFGFDPAQMLAANRVRYVVAALAIIRAHITAGRPKVVKGRTASFEVWDDLVRQPLCWLADLVRQHNDAHHDDLLPTFDDPMKAAALAFEADPETAKHGALLEAWHREFAGAPTTVAQAIKKSERPGFPGELNPLADALDEIGGHGGRLNPRMIGRWIEKMLGRRIGGRYFSRAGLRRGVMHWSVKTSTDPCQINTPKPTTPTTEYPSGARTDLQVAGDGVLNSGHGAQHVPGNVAKDDVLAHAAGDDDDPFN